MTMPMIFAQSSECPELSEIGKRSPDLLLGCLTSLSAQQIDAGMSEAAVTAGELSTSLMQAASAVSKLRANADEEADENLSALSGHVMTAFAGLQFLDRLQQRMQNVSGNLTQLADVIGESDAEQQWGVLIDALRSRYTMESERTMLEEALADLKLSVGVVRGADQ